MHKELVSVGVLAGIDRAKSDSIVILPDSVKMSEDEVNRIAPSRDFQFPYSYFGDVYINGISYYIHDHLGNTRVVYTPVSGNCNDATKPFTYTLEHAADYYPGVYPERSRRSKILREFQNGLGAEKYLTTHHERDTETGLDYRGARYYDSDVARFLSLDPLAMEFVSWSPYNYVLASPIKLIDVNGKAPQEGNDNKEGGKPAKQDGHGGLTHAKDNTTQIALNIVQFGELKEKGSISSVQGLNSFFSNPENINTTFGINVMRKNGIEVGADSDGNISVGKDGVNVSATSNSKAFYVPFLGGASVETETVTKIVTANVLDPLTGKSQSRTFPVQQTQVTETIVIGVHKMEMRTITQGDRTISKEAREGISIGVSKGFKDKLEVGAEIDFMKDSKPVNELK